MATTPPDAPEPCAVGIAGAGQLARMTCLAAWPLGITVAILGLPGEPAAPLASTLVEGEWRDADDVAALGRACKVLTLENEFVEASALAAVEAAGTPVRPTSASIATIQDKALQKQLLKDAGLPVPRFVVAESAGDLDAVGRDLRWPLMLKARKLGYDGRGNATCDTPEQAREAFARFDRGEGVLVEETIRFDHELAAMIARSTTGETLSYPVVETVQRNHVCHEVRAPAPMPEATAHRASHVAVNAATAADALGVMGVEMFLVEDRVLVNELAPRPHNSGHYTIEACETSQFENHLRGILGLPLGSVEMRTPAAVMVNLLGSRSAPARPRIARALGVRGAHVHLYDKAEVRPGRKMGHVTALGRDLGVAQARARRAADGVGL